MLILDAATSLVHNTWKLVIPGRSVLDTPDCKLRSTFSAYRFTPWPNNARIDGTGPGIAEKPIESDVDWRNVLMLRDVTLSSSFSSDHHRATP